MRLIGREQLQERQASIRTIHSQKRLATGKTSHILRFHNSVTQDAVPSSTAYSHELSGAMALEMQSQQSCIDGPAESMLCQRHCLCTLWLLHISGLLDSS